MRDADAFAPGQILGGGFTVRARLGSTVWATTYAGLAAPRRDVAIKVYRAEVGHRSDIIAKLEQADAAALATPPRLVLHPVGGGRDHASGLWYRVTPLSVQPSLAQLTELCPLSLDELVVFVGNAARALAAAHDRGLAHGALKPSNVFVGPAPRHTVQLADFGAAACLAAFHAPPDEALPWLSPEQTVGALATPASDVFGLALVAFHGATRATLRHDDLARSTASEQARAAGVALPPELDEVFARALSAKPSLRYATVVELAEAFRAVIASRPSQHIPLELAVTALAAAPPLSSAAPLTAGSEPELATRRRRLVVAGGVAAAVLVATSGALVWRARTPSRALPATAATATTASGGSPAGPSTSTDAPPPSPSPAATSAGGSPARPLASADAPSVAASAPSPPPEKPPAGATQISVECEPSCEFVMIDGRAAKHFPLRVAPGAHGVGVSRRGFFGDWRKVKVTKGEHEVVKFQLHVDPKKKRR